MKSIRDDSNDNADNDRVSLDRGKDNKVEGCKVEFESMLRSIEKK